MPVPGPAAGSAPATPVAATPALHAVPGRAQLDTARDRLAALADRPLVEQVAGFDEVHRLLQDALAGVQQVAPPGGGS